MYSPKWKQFSRIIHLLIIFVNGMRYIVNIQYVLIINEICLDRPNKLLTKMVLCCFAKKFDDSRNSKINYIIERITRRPEKKEKF